MVALPLTTKLEFDEELVIEPPEVMDKLLTVKL